jgi:hypothetical protein
MDVPKQKVDVEFQAKGLGRLKSDCALFAGNLLEPVAVLAAGGTKAQAIWSGFRNVFDTHVLGPVSLVSGAAVGFLVTTQKLISAWKDMGMASAAAI